MILETLELQNYRNHTKLRIELNPQTTLILGENGAGKTNIIEAINFLATGKGFKATYDKEIINVKTQEAIIRATIRRKNTNSLNIGIRIRTLDTTTNRASKTVKIRGKTTKITDLPKYFNTVLFSPIEMNLLRGSPSQRRTFLNNVLSQSSETYRKTLSQYEKARRQRNKVLELIRDMNTGFAQLQFWNSQILKFGRNIQSERESFIEETNKNVKSIIKAIDPNISANIVYNANPLSEEILEAIQQREIQAGRTLVGPHREDFFFKEKQYGDNTDFSKYASRGQQRTLILALKLCEVQYLETHTGERPILLLDDIFSELDEKHREAIKNTLGQQQTILTGTDIPDNLKYNSIIKL